MRSQQQYRGKNYKQCEMIGKGRYGTIYRVQSLTTNQQFVAKHIPLDQIQQGSAQKQLQIIKTLHHPYIVQYIDSFTTTTDFVIIMEYCTQKDLDHHIQLMKSKKKRFNQNLIITWVFQLVLGIQFIHSKKILHRDIKPQNIFIDDKMNIKIGDFGISKILNATEEQCKTMMGTPFYLAPEIVNEELYTTKADIWSLGCLIYQICALEKPFEAKGGILKLMDTIKNGPIKPIPSNYSQDLRKLVSKMMTRDQSIRPNTTQLLKDPLLVDLMIKSSSSMSLKNEYIRNLEENPKTLTQSFINKQTHLVHEQLNRFEQQVQQKMLRLKKKNLNSKQIDEQYNELKRKMVEIERVIGKAFGDLKKRAEGNTISSSDDIEDSAFKPSSQSLMKKSTTIQNSSGLTDSSDMTIIESVDIPQRKAQKKSSKIQSISTSFESVPLISTRTNVFQQKDNNDNSNTSSMILTESIAFREDQDDENGQSLGLSSKVSGTGRSRDHDNLENSSFQQTLVSQYQQTHKTNTNTNTQSAMDKLEFLHKTITRNPDSILNTSLLNFTLTMSEDEIRRSIRKDQGLISNKVLSSNNRIKTNPHLDDSLNLNLTKQSISDSSNSLQLNFNNSNKAFQKRKLLESSTNGKLAKQPLILHDEKQEDNDQNDDDEYYEDDFEEYEEDFEDQQDQQQSQKSQSQSNSFDSQAQNSTLTQSQKRRIEMNTIKSFYQQTLIEFNNNQSAFNSNSSYYEQKMKNKYPLVMSEIKQQTGEAGSILSKKNGSNEGNVSQFGI